MSALALTHRSFPGTIHSASRNRLRLLAVVSLLLSLVVWGTADRLAPEHDRHFQAAAVKDCLLATVQPENTGPDGGPDDALKFAAPRPFPQPAPVTAHVGSAAYGTPRLAEPGLARAPPA